MARTDPAETTHDLTVSTINDLIRGYRRDRQAAVAELILIEKRRAAGVPEPQPLTDTEKLARERAVELINGHGTASMFVPPAASREQQLQVEIRGLDLVLDALATREVQQRSVEAVQWLDRHGGEWNAVCRDILLCATKLAALENKAARLKSEQGFWVTLPLAEFIGGRSILGIAWQADPLNTPIQHALREKIITAAEVKEAERV
jgi:hypothetical protein